MGKDIQKGTDTQLNSNQYSAFFVSAVALSESKVFIIYTPQSSFQLYGTICMIEGTAITKGQDIQLGINTYQTMGKQVVKLSENKVFIAYGAEEDNYYLYGMICKIEGMEITFETSTKLSTTKYSGSTFSVAALNENKVFIAYSNQNNYGLYGLVCAISETTITAGTQTTLSFTTGAGFRISVTALSEAKVFIVHSLNSERYMNGMVCIINETTIASKTDKALITQTGAGYDINIVTLSENRVFIAHGLGSDEYLYGTICTVDTDITVETTVRLSEVLDLHYIQSVQLLKNSKVFIVYDNKIDGSSFNTSLCGMICNINKSAVTVEINTSLNTEQYSGSNVSVTKLTDSIIFIAHAQNTDRSLYAMVCTDEIYTEVNLLENLTDDIYGVAKTNAIEGDTIDIYRPYKEVAV